LSCVGKGGKKGGPDDDGDNLSKGEAKGVAPGAPVQFVIGVQQQSHDAVESVASRAAEPETVKGFKSQAKVFAVEEGQEEPVVREPAASSSSEGEVRLLVGSALVGSALPTEDVLLSSSKAVGRNEPREESEEKQEKHKEEEEKHVMVADRPAATALVREDEKAEAKGRSEKKRDFNFRRAVPNLIGTLFVSVLVKQLTSRNTYSVTIVYPEEERRRWLKFDPPLIYRGKRALPRDPPRELKINM